MSNILNVWQSLANVSIQPDVPPMVSKGHLVDIKQDLILNTGILPIPISIRYIAKSIRYPNHWIIPVAPGV